MITWHEVFDSATIKGVFRPASFSAIGENLNGGPESITLEGSGINYTGGDSWFGPEPTSSVSLLMPEGFGAGPQGGAVCGEDFGGGTASFVFITGITESYEAGGRTVTPFGVGFFQPAEGEQYSEAGPATCEDEIFFDSNWSRSTTTLNTYSFTTFTTSGRTTFPDTVQTSFIEINETDAESPEDVFFTTTLGTSSIEILKSTWTNASYQTVLTRGQTFKVKYSRYGNNAPATTAETFGKITFVTVEETEENIFFVEQTTVDTATFVPYQILNSIKTLDNEDVGIQSTAFVSGSSFGQGASGPKVFPDSRTIFAGSIGSTYYPVTIKNVNFSPPTSDNSPFVEKEAKFINTINKTIDLGVGAAVVNYKTTQNITSFDALNTYEETKTFTDEDWFGVGFGGTITATSQKMTPVSSAGGVEAMGQGGEALGNISLEIACKLSPEFIDGGGEFVVPTPTGLDFALATVEAIVPATGRAIDGDSTYLYSGDRWTKEFFIGSRTTRDFGLIDISGNSTSFYFPTFYGIEGHRFLGGKIAGNSFIPAGILAVYSGGIADSLVQNQEEPVAISWGNDAEVTAYRNLEFFEISGRNTFSSVALGKPDEVVDASPILATELWPLGDVIDD